MNTTSTAFCINCGDKVAYTLCSEQRTSVIRGIEFSCIEQKALCPDCGEEIYVAEVNDANVQAREDAYRIAASLITVDEINEILQKYKIGAGPIAKLLGLGEVTVNRYVEGQLPSRANSDKLREVLYSHEKMSQYLEKGKDRITAVAYSKCRSELDRLNELYGKGKIDVIARFFLSNANDITPMALQKLLYYAQSFYRALYGENLFTDSCQAWAYGPVYPEVYRKFRNYGYDPIEATIDFSYDLSELSTREKSVLESIIRAFGCYSGTTLSRFTHNERPWSEARGTLNPTDRCSNIIDGNSICRYFTHVVEKYNIVNPCDIKKYSDDMYANAR